MASARPFDVLAHALQIDLVVHLGREASHVEAQLLGVGVQVLELEVILMRKQSVVHLPELALGCRAFRHLGGAQRVRMNPLERKVAIGESNSLGEALEQQLHGGGCLPTGRTLEITVFDDRNRSVRRTSNVIRLADGLRQVYVWWEARAHRSLGITRPTIFPMFVCVPRSPTWDRKYSSMITYSTTSRNRSSRPAGQSQKLSSARSRMPRAAFASRPDRCTTTRS